MYTTKRINTKAMIKKTSLFVIAAWILLVAFTLEKAPLCGQQAQKGFAVIELFTSEGCSSCPPADALIARIEKETTDQQIYILAHHVDYWTL